MLCKGTFEIHQKNQKDTKKYNFKSYPYFSGLGLSIYAKLLESRSTICMTPLKKILFPCRLLLKTLINNLYNVGKLSANDSILPPDQETSGLSISLL
jgi:hypothetical protein